MKKPFAFVMILLLGGLTCSQNKAFAEAEAKAVGKDEFNPDFFQQNIREEGECYLVCEYAAEIHPHGIKSLAAQGEKELHVKAVVVDVAKGSMVRGDKLEYIQYWGSEEQTAQEADKRIGGLAFVFHVKTGTGLHFFDPQDPRSRRKYSKDFSDGLFKFYGSKPK